MEASSAASKVPEIVRVVSVVVKSPEVPVSSEMVVVTGASGPSIIWNVDDDEESPVLSETVTVTV